jgi:hypothetical protein
MTYKIICNIKTINKCKNYLLNVNGFPEIKVPVLVICYWLIGKMRGRPYVYWLLANYGVACAVIRKWTNNQLPNNKSTRMQFILSKENLQLG